MEIKRDKVIVLADNTKYIIIKIVTYGGVKYLLGVELTGDEKNITKKVAIMEEVVKGDELFVCKIKDNELLKVLHQVFRNAY